jgi:hypothetical protein
LVLTPLEQIWLISSHKNANTNLKLAAIDFLLQFLRVAKGNALPYVDRLASVIINAKDDHFYKVAGQALTGAGLLVIVMHPSCEVPMDSSVNSEIGNNVILNLYKCLWEVLTVSNADAEVKQKGLHSMGILLSHAGNLIPSSSFSDHLTPFIIKSLQNETLKLTAINLIASLAESQIIQDMKVFNLHIFIPEIAALIPKFQSRVAILNCLEAIMRNSRSAYDHNSLKLFNTILNDLCIILASPETDVHILSRIFPLASVILKYVVEQNELEVFTSKFVPAVVGVIANSPHLVAGGAGLDSLLRLWTQMIRFSEKSQVFQVGIKGLMEHATETSSKESFPIIAKCVGAIYEQPLSANVSKLIGDFLGYIANPSASENMTHIALLSLGELG